VTWLLVAAVGLPALGALAWPWRGPRSVALILAPWAAVPALVLALLHLAEPSRAPLVEIPLAVIGLRLGLDGPGGAFLLVTAVLWLIAGAFARSYHARDPRREAFFAFFLLTLTGNLGVVLAQELVSFYLFFALMTFSAYGLVIHGRHRKAIRAGRVYLVMAIAGELALLAGVLALSVPGGGIVEFGSQAGSVWLGLLMVGFGVKAGLAPLHLWLPLAHPVAPTAASALLSGALVKAGLLGWIRVLPADVGIPSMAGVLLVAGAATALYGILVGLCQDDAKTVLAYSTVSQMGFMAMGTGLLAGDPALAPAALAAVVFYALHHAAAKGSLFLAVGVMDRISGTGASAERRRRRVLAGALLPALALAGAPLTSGALAKTALKDAASGLQAAAAWAMEPLLMVAAAGTTLVMARFLVTLLHRSLEGGAPEGSEHARVGIQIPWGLIVPWALLLGVVLAGPLWIPRAYPDPGGAGASLSLYRPLAALLPVLAGALVAGCVVLRPGILGPGARLRIPPGDLVIPLEWLVRRGLEAGRPSGEQGAEPVAERHDPGPWRSGPWRSWARTRLRLDELTRAGRPPMRGAAFGFLAFALTLVLALALLV